MIFIMRKQEGDEKDLNTTATPSFDHFKAKPLDRGEDGVLISTGKDDSISFQINEMIDSIRCIRISPDGT